MWAHRVGWVTATKAGDTNYNAVSSSEQTVNVNTKANQAALTISSSASKTYGSDLALSTSGGSGTGAVSYSVSTAGTAGCSVSGRLCRRPVMWGRRVGDGDEGRDTNYNSVSSSEQTVNVNTKANQAALTISSSASKTYGSDLALSTSAVGRALVRSPIRCRPRAPRVVPSSAPPQLLVAHHRRRRHIVWGDGDKGGDTNYNAVSSSDRR